MAQIEDILEDIQKNALEAFNNLCDFEKSQCEIDDQHIGFSTYKVRIYYVSEIAEQAIDKSIKTDLLALPRYKLDQLVSHLNASDLYDAIGKISIQVIETANKQLND